MEVFITIKKSLIASHAIIYSLERAYQGVFPSSHEEDRRAP